MFSDKAAIRVEGVSKCYQIYDHPQDRLKQYIIPRLRRFFRQKARSYFKNFNALRDISFEVQKGETIGIVGRNGSGKSTLLQIICGTLEPSYGKVQVKGRIAALLELGSGFNPEFTGRENVYMNGAVLGLSQVEIDEHFDRIAAFADIGEFIDQPVKVYSSGMVVRLAFAVQAQVNPDILIVDEALAVGDAKFQAKCFEQLKRLKANGTSILLVTHSTEQIVTHCSRAILLDQGRMVLQGEPRQVVNRYLDLLFGRNDAQSTNAHVNNLADEPKKPNFSSDENGFAKRPGYNPGEYRWGDSTAIIADYWLSSATVEYPSLISCGAPVELAIDVRFKQRLIRPILGISIKTKEGVTVYGTNSELLRCDDLKDVGEPDHKIVANIAFACNLAPGDYFISLGIATRQGEEIIPHDRRYDAIHIVVGNKTDFYGLVDLQSRMNVQRA